MHLSKEEEESREKLLEEFSSEKRPAPLVELQVQVLVELLVLLQAHQQPLVLSILPERPSLHKLPENPTTNRDKNTNTNTKTKANREKREDE